MLRKRLLTLTVALALAVPLAMGGVTVHRASAASNSHGVASICQQYGDEVSYFFSLSFVNNFLPPGVGFDQPVSLSQGACTSLITGYITGTYATSAPYQAACREAIASTPYLQGVPGIQGSCVSYYSSTGYKVLINYFTFL